MKNSQNKVHAKISESTVECTVNHQVILNFYCDIFRPSISKPLQDLILRMLDKNPETRITLPQLKVSNILICLHITFQESFVYY